MVQAAAMGKSKDATSADMHVHDCPDAFTEELAISRIQMDKDRNSTQMYQKVVCQRNDIQADDAQN